MGFIAWFDGWDNNENRLLEMRLFAMIVKAFKLLINKSNEKRLSDQKKARKRTSFLFSKSTDSLTKQVLTLNWRPQSCFVQG